MNINKFYTRWHLWETKKDLFVEKKKDVYKKIRQDAITKPRRFKWERARHWDPKRLNDWRDVSINWPIVWRMKKQRFIEKETELAYLKLWGWDTDILRDNDVIDNLKARYKQSGIKVSSDELKEFNKKYLFFRSEENKDTKEKKEDYIHENKDLKLGKVNFLLDDFDRESNEFSSLRENWIKQCKRNIIPAAPFNNMKNLCENEGKLRIKIWMKLIKRRIGLEVWNKLTNEEKYITVLNTYKDWDLNLKYFNKMVILNNQEQVFRFNKERIIWKNRYTLDKLREKFPFIYPEKIKWRYMEDKAKYIYLLSKMGKRKKSLDSENLKKGSLSLIDNKTKIESSAASRRPPLNKLLNKLLAKLCEGKDDSDDSDDSSRTILNKKEQVITIERKPKSKPVESEQLDKSEMEKKLKDTWESESCTESSIYQVPSVSIDGKLLSAASSCVKLREKLFDIFNKDDKDKEVFDKLIQEKYGFLINNLIVGKKKKKKNKGVLFCTKKVSGQQKYLNNKYIKENQLNFNYQDNTNQIITHNNFNLNPDKSINMNTFSNQKCFDIKDNKNRKKNKIIKKNIFNSYSNINKSIKNDYSCSKTKQVTNNSDVQVEQNSINIKSTINTFKSLNEIQKQNKNIIKSKKLDSFSHPPFGPRGGDDKSSRPGGRDSFSKNKFSTFSKVSLNKNFNVEPLKLNKNTNIKENSSDKKKNETITKENKITKLYTKIIGNTFKYRKLNNMKNTPLPSAEELEVLIKETFNFNVRKNHNIKIVDNKKATEIFILFWLEEWLKKSKKMANNIIAPKVKMRYIENSDKVIKDNVKKNNKKDLIEYNEVINKVINEKSLPMDKNIYEKIFMKYINLNPFLRNEKTILLKYKFRELYLKRYRANFFIKKNKPKNLSLKLNQDLSTLFYKVWTDRKIFSIRRKKIRKLKKKINKWDIESRRLNLFLLHLLNIELEKSIQTDYLNLRKKGKVPGKRTWQEKRKGFFNSKNKHRKSQSQSQPQSQKQSFFLLGKKHKKKNTPAKWMRYSNRIIGQSYSYIDAGKSVLPRFYFTKWITEGIIWKRRLKPIFSKPNLTPRQLYHYLLRSSYFKWVEASVNHDICKFEIIKILKSMPNWTSGLRKKRKSFPITIKILKEMKRIALTNNRNSDIKDTLSFTKSNQLIKYKEKSLKKIGENKNVYSFFGGIISRKNYIGKVVNNHKDKLKINFISKFAERAVLKKTSNFVYIFDGNKPYVFTHKYYMNNGSRYLYDFIESRSMPIKVIQILTMENKKPIQSQIDRYYKFQKDINMLCNRISPKLVKNIIFNSWSIVNLKRKRIELRLRYVIEQINNLERDVILLRNTILVFIDKRKKESEKERRFKVPYTFSHYHNNNSKINFEDYYTIDNIYVNNLNKKYLNIFNISMADIMKNNINLSSYVGGENINEENSKVFLRTHRTKDMKRKNTSFGSGSSFGWKIFFKLFKKFCFNKFSYKKRFDTSDIDLLTSFEIMKKNNKLKKRLKKSSASPDNIIWSKGRLAGNYGRKGKIFKLIKRRWKISINRERRKDNILRTKKNRIKSKRFNMSKLSVLSKEFKCKERIKKKILFLQHGINERSDSAKKNLTTRTKKRLKEIRTMNGIKLDKISIINNLKKPYYSFPLQFNERLSLSQVKHWTSSTYSFYKLNIRDTNFLDIYTSKLIKLFFSVKYLKKRQSYYKELSLAFKFRLNKNLSNTINNMIKYTTSQTSRLGKGVNNEENNIALDPIILTWKWTVEQFEKSQYIRNIINFRKLDVYSGIAGKHRIYFKKLRKMILSKPLFKHTPHNLIIDLYLYENVIFTKKFLPYILRRRGILKYMYSMYVNSLKKIENTIDRPRFFYMNIISPNVFFNYHWIVQRYKNLLIRLPLNFNFSLLFLQLKIFNNIYSWNSLANTFFLKRKCKSWINKFSSYYTIFNANSSHLFNNKNVENVLINNIDNNINNDNSNSREKNISSLNDFYNNYKNINNDLISSSKNLQVADGRSFGQKKRIFIRKSYNLSLNLYKKKYAFYLPLYLKKKFNIIYFTLDKKIFDPYWYLRCLEKIASVEKKKGWSILKGLRKIKGKKLIINNNKDTYLPSGSKKENSGSRSYKEPSDKILSNKKLTKNNKQRFNVLISKKENSKLRLKKELSNMASTIVNNVDNNGIIPMHDKEMKKVRNNRRNFAFNNMISFFKDEDKYDKSIKVASLENLKENIRQVKNMNIKGLDLSSTFIDNLNNRLKEMDFKLESALLDIESKKDYFDMKVNNKRNRLFYAINKDRNHNKCEYIDSRFKNQFIIQSRLANTDYLSKEINDSNLNLSHINIKGSNNFFPEYKYYSWLHPYWYFTYSLVNIKEQFLKISREVLLNKQDNILPYLGEDYKGSKNKTYILRNYIHNDKKFKYDNNIEFTFFGSFIPNNRENEISRNIGFNENIFKPHYRYMIPLFITNIYIKFVNNFNGSNILYKVEKFLNTNKKVGSKENALSLHLAMYKYISVKVLLDLLRYNYKSLIRVKPKYNNINKLRRTKAKWKKLGINSWFNSLRFIKKLRLAPFNFWKRYHKLSKLHYNQILRSGEHQTNRNIFVPFVLYFEDLLFNIYGKWALIRLWPLKKLYLSSFVLAKRLVTMLKLKRKKWKPKFNRFTRFYINHVRAFKIKKFYTDYIDNKSTWPVSLLEKNLGNYYNKRFPNYYFKKYEKNIPEKNRPYYVYPLKVNDNPSRFSSYLNKKEKEYSKEVRKSILNIKWKKGKAKTKLGLINCRPIFFSDTFIFNSFKTKLRMQKGSWDKNNISSRLMFSDISSKKVLDVGISDFYKYLKFWLLPFNKIITSINKDTDITGIQIQAKGKLRLFKKGMRKLNRIARFGHFYQYLYKSSESYQKFTIPSSRIRNDLKPNVDYSSLSLISRSGVLNFKVWIASQISADVNLLLIHLVRIKELYTRLYNKFFFVNPILKQFTSYTKHNYNLLKTYNMNVILRDTHVKYTYPKTYNTLEVFDDTKKWKNNWRGTQSRKRKSKLSFELGKKKMKLISNIANRINKLFLLDLKKDTKDLNSCLDYLKNLNSNIHGFTKPRHQKKMVNLLKYQISKYKKYRLSSYKSFDMKFKNYLYSKFSFKKAEFFFLFTLLNYKHILRSYNKYYFIYFSLIQEIRREMLLNPLFRKVGLELRNLKKDVSNKKNKINIIHKKIIKSNKNGNKK